MVLFQDESIKVIYNADEQAMYAHWSKESEFISDESFRKVNEMYLKFAEQYEITYFLLNTKDFHYSIPVDTQAWVAENILPTLKKKGMQKVAFIVSKEFVAQLSIELTMSENPDILNIQYFSNESEAKSWLFTS